MRFRRKNEERRILINVEGERGGIERGNDELGQGRAKEAGDGGGKIRSFIVFLFQMFVTMIIVFVLLAGVSYVALRHFIVREEIEVPNIVGLSLEEGIRRIRVDNIGLKLEGEEYSEIVIKGGILSQYPHPGTMAKVGSDIKVVISRGAMLVEVPNLRGETLLRAGIRLRGADLQVGNIARIESMEVGKEGVISQDPPGGSGAIRKGEVSLLVSAGEPRLEFLMPSLVGMTLREASELMANLGIKLRDIREVEERGSEKGMILSQEPLAGEVIDKGVDVRLRVASGLDAIERVDVNKN